MDLDRNRLLDSLAPFIEAGVAIHWLRPKSKAPVNEAWSSAPIATLSDLKQTHVAGYNVGVRLGEPSRLGTLYLHLIDLDIRDASKAAEAKAKLLELWPEAPSFPFVISGSGGESRHFYLLTERPFRSKKLAHADAFKMVFDPKKGREVKKWDWEIELFGTGKQAVLPPSIHDTTGNPYVWGRPLDLEAIDMGLGPIVPVDQVRSWMPVQAEPAEDETELRPKLGLSADEARKILADLPLDAWCEDRDGWLQAGMALHHEFGGEEIGLVLWNEFAKQSAKFDEKDQRRVWRSFREKPNSVRMATLKKAAMAARFERMFDEQEDEAPAPAGEHRTFNGEDDLLGDDDDFDDEDLLGEAEPAAGDDDLLGDVPVKPAATGLKVDPNWMQKLDRNEEGAIKPTLHNVELIIRNDPRTFGVPGFNLFTQEVVMRGKPGIRKMAKESPKGTKQLTGPIWVLRDPVNGDLWSDAHDSAIRTVIEAPIRQGGYAIKVSDRDLKAAVDLCARSNAFHPVREYLDGLTWDGTPRLETLFIRYLGAEDNAYSRHIAKLTLTAGVVRVFEPGHKYDFALILEGMQGKRKSTFIEILARHWFAELNGNFHDRKEMVERMQGSWICELPELQGFTKSEVQDIKAFISARKDKVRLAYARRAQEFPRQSIMIGSTNETHYLRDTTGGRRFWPVKCQVTTIDTDGLALEVDQLWAEAVHLYREMRKAKPAGTLPLFLSDEDAATVAKRLQEDRRVETSDDADAGEILAWLETPVTDPFDDADDDLVGAPEVYRQETCLVQLWVEALGRPRAHYDNRAAQALGRAISKIEGWTGSDEQHRFGKYGKQRVYRRQPAA